MLEVVEKPWGVTRCIYKGPHTEVWHANIRAGGESSVHRHLRKVNEFYVVRGDLTVEVLVGELHEIHLLRGSGRFKVDPRHWHQFRALTDVELIETYYLPEIEPEDIDREGAGVTPWRKRSSSRT